MADINYGQSSGVAKKTSFQITSVTVDGGDDSADDLDESHTEDSLDAATDVSRNDIFYNPAPPSSMNIAPVIPTSSQYGLAIVPEGLNSAPNEAPPPATPVINDAASAKTDNTDKDIVHNRFKVVKIVSAEPFKKGRWMCMDYFDHTTTTTGTTTTVKDTISPPQVPVNVQQGSNVTMTPSPPQQQTQHGVAVNQNHIAPTQALNQNQISHQQQSSSQNPQVPLIPQSIPNAHNAQIHQAPVQPQPSHMPAQSLPHGAHAQMTGTTSASNSNNPSTGSTQQSQQQHHHTAQSVGHNMLQQNKPAFMNPSQSQNPQQQLITPQQQQQQPVLGNMQNMNPTPNYQTGGAMLQQINPGGVNQQSGQGMYTTTGQMMSHALQQQSAVIQNQAGIVGGTEEGESMGKELLLASQQSGIGNPSNINPSQNYHSGVMMQQINPTSVAQQTGQAMYSTSGQMISHAMPPSSVMQNQQMMQQPTQMMGIMSQPQMMSQMMQGSHTSSPQSGTMSQQQQQQGIPQAQQNLIQQRPQQQQPPNYASVPQQMMTPQPQGHMMSAQMQIPLQQQHSQPQQQHTIASSQPQQQHHPQQMNITSQPPSNIYQTPSQPIQASQANAAQNMHQVHTIIPHLSQNPQVPSSGAQLQGCSIDSTSSISSHMSNMSNDPQSHQQQTQPVMQQQTIAVTTTNPNHIQQTMAPGAGEAHVPTQLSAVPPPTVSTNSTISTKTSLPTDHMNMTGESTNVGSMNEEGESHMAKQQSAMANQQTLNPTQTQNYQAGMMMQQMNPASVNQSGQGVYTSSGQMGHAVGQSPGVQGQSVMQQPSQMMNIMSHTQPQMMTQMMQNTRLGGIVMQGQPGVPQQGHPVPQNRIPQQPGPQTNVASVMQQQQMMSNQSTLIASQMHAAPQQQSQQATPSPAQTHHMQHPNLTPVQQNIYQTPPQQQLQTSQADPIQSNSNMQTMHNMITPVPQNIQQIPTSGGVHLPGSSIDSIASNSSSIANSSEPHLQQHQPQPIPSTNPNTGQTQPSSTNLPEGQTSQQAPPQTNQGSASGTSKSSEITTLSAAATVIIDGVSSLGEAGAGGGSNGGNEDGESATGTNTVAIDNKIEQAMDLVKSHLMFAVREEVEVLKEKISELMERITQLEYENTILRANASQETLAQLQKSTQHPAPNVNENHQGFS